MSNFKKGDRVRVKWSGDAEFNWLDDKIGTIEYLYIYWHVSIPDYKNEWDDDGLWPFSANELELVE